MAFCSGHGECSPSFYDRCCDVTGMQIDEDGPQSFAVCSVQRK